MIGRKNGTQGADGKAVQLRGALDRCLEAFHPSSRSGRPTRLDWRRLFVGRILVEVERSDLPWQLGMDDNPSINSIGFWPLIENDNVDFKATLYERIRWHLLLPAARRRHLRWAITKASLFFFPSAEDAPSLEIATPASANVSVISTSIGRRWLAEHMQHYRSQPAWGNSRRKLQQGKSLNLLTT